ncbi:hypothetical protein Leryth_011210 [Lithospermum erythrorhizon]|nr:hypothetical protein Leryth_011210 [Lithospermum erythrorhizon]
MRSINWRHHPQHSFTEARPKMVEMPSRSVSVLLAAVNNLLNHLSDDQPTPGWYKLDLLLHKTPKKTRTWLIAPGSKDIAPRILFDRSSEDVYSDPGSPMLRRTPAGTYVIAKIKKESDSCTYILLNGSGATPSGNIPFLDLFDITSVLYCELIEKKSWQVTNFIRIPLASHFALVKEMIRYKRKDGVQLTATLYLPPGYDPAKDGPLPCLVWSYPGEFKSKDAAGQVRGSPNEFYIGSLPMLWLARRHVFTPTISNLPKLRYFLSCGPSQTLLVVTLGLSWLQTFCRMRKDSWEATNIYVEMSPFMSANKIKKPILLIHGEEDNNPGTLTMQSHGYAAQESVMHVLWETDRWLQSYCLTNASDAKHDLDALESRTNTPLDLGSKTVGATGGALEQADQEIDGIHFARRMLWP